MASGGKKKSDGNKKSPVKRFLGYVRRFFMGEFISYRFFLRNWAYVVVIVLIFIVYTASRYRVQSLISETIKLKTELANARTEKVKASAAYNSLIREPEMRARVKKAQLNLAMPDAPHYRLDIQ